MVEIRQCMIDRSTATTVREMSGTDVEYGLVNEQAGILLCNYAWAHVVSVVQGNNERTYSTILSAYF